MTVFKFRLEKILQLKLLQENQIKQLLSGIKAKLRAVEEEISSMEEEISKIQQDVVENCKQGMTGYQLQQWKLMIDLMSLILEEKRKELQKIKEEEERLKEEFLNTMRERKILEKLKLRRFQAFVQKLDRINRLYLDEVALRRYLYGGEKTGS
ncbi:flagellar export protein FliJ [Pseudothermotoga thermarum]|uniref:Flagellar FliJ protein n=1 Tax=Pseudothermotoga thermarum DSM 5069 TaxID=688269 RepID=F7YU86_9THEM|nr:flagellar FliJ family protein [Pseudothermotoga thermarum]AEH50183.1 flagellar export protein FliJ [Pseudothermotoga thermarum DSM 5069]